jgi:hypothetical protein
MPPLGHFSLIRFTKTTEAAASEMERSAMQAAG